MTLQDSSYTRVQETLAKFSFHKVLDNTNDVVLECTPNSLWKDSDSFVEFIKVVHLQDWSRPALPLKGGDIFTPISCDSTSYDAARDNAEFLYLRWTLA